MSALAAICDGVAPDGLHSGGTFSWDGLLCLYPKEDLTAVEVTFGNKFVVETELISLQAQLQYQRMFGR